MATDVDSDVPREFYGLEMTVIYHSSEEGDRLICVRAAILNDPIGHLRNANTGAVADRTSRVA